MAPDFEMRFFVGVADGRRSGPWRVWTKRNDVYVGARQIAGQLKVSLHASGQCNHAFTSELVRALDGEDTLPHGKRRQQTWQCDRGASTGLACALRLVFPTSELRPLGTVHVSDKAHLAIPPAPDGKQVSVCFCFARSGPVLESSPAIVVIADIALLDGTRFIAFHRPDQVAPGVREAIASRRTGNIHIRSIRGDEPAIEPTDTTARMIFSGQFAGETFVTLTEAALLPDAA
jgi:hypothetical protein